MAAQNARPSYFAARRLAALCVLPALLATALGCDPKGGRKPSLAPSELHGFTAAGLQVEERALVHFEDGSVAPRASRADLALRSTPGAPRPTRETPALFASLATPEPWSASIEEYVLFASEAEGLALRAEHGIVPPTPGGGAIGSFVANGGWLDPPASTGSLTGGGRVPPPPVRPFLPFGGLASVPVPEPPGGSPFGFLGPIRGGVGPLPPGPGQVTGGTSSVVRYAMSDGLALHALPNFAGASLMELARGDRVFVLDTLPTPGAGGHVFVRVQVADRSPFPAGWIPLHWPAVIPGHATAGTVDVNASYGLFGRLARDFVAEQFWKGCDHYPVFPHDAAFFSAPVVVDGSIPYAQRYSCGELPVGTVENATWKHITTYSYETPELEWEFGGVKWIDIDSILFQVPVKLYRLPWQKRGANYSIKDLSTGWYQQFNDSNADVVAHSRYARLPGVIEEQHVRVHDTDLWYNVTFTPPPGVQDIGAEAYLNACFHLPGVRIEGAPVPMNVTIQGAFATSHIQSIHWGIFDVSPFRLCTTAAISTHAGDPVGGFTTGPHAPMRLRLLRASLHGVGIQTVKGLELGGSLQGAHGTAISALVSLLNIAMQQEGALGMVFEAYFRRGLEVRLLSVLNEMTGKLAQGLPDPRQQVRNACDLMPPAYASPPHRYYPLSRLRRDAAQAAQVPLPTTQHQPASACHTDPNAYGRANDVTSFTSPEDTQDLYFVRNFSTGEPEATVVQRPWWNGCGLQSEVDTVAPHVYWPFLGCANEVLDDALNYRMSSGAAQNRLQSECTVPAVKALCDWDGGGDDLLALWSPHGTPPLGNALSFCPWDRALTAPDLPDFQVN